MKPIILRSFQAMIMVSLCVAFPSHAQFMDGVQQIVVSAPVSKRKKVSICYGQLSRYPHCDYQQGSLNKMTVPFWGQIIYTQRIVANAESRATFIVHNEDGGCSLQLTDETFMRNTHIVGNGNVLSWDVSQASLGDGSECFADGDSLTIETDITVSIENGSGGINLVQVTLSNSPAETPSSNSYQLQDMVIKTAKQ